MPMEPPVTNPTPTILPPASLAFVALRRAELAASPPSHGAAPDEAVAAIEAALVLPVVMVAQPVQQQQAQAAGALEAAAARVSIERLRAKADAASNPVDAARLRAAAGRIEGDLAEAATEIVAPAWIQITPTRRDLTGARGVILGSVTKLHGMWHADLVPTAAHSRTARIKVGSFREEAEARSVVERGTRAPRPTPAALPEIARRFAPAASAPLTHIVRFRVNRCGSAAQDWLAETKVGDTADDVADFLASGDLEFRDGREVLAVFVTDLDADTPVLINVTRAILERVAAKVEANGTEIPRSLEAVFTRLGVPQPMAWVETEFRDHNDEHRQGPADCLDRLRAA